MSGILILIVCIIYGIVSIDLLLKGQSALALTFFAYSLSNIGLFYASK